jgi:hypothetical protein
MKGKMGLRIGMVMVMVAVLVGWAILAAAQDKQADNMQILLDKIKADKKLLVANNMDLTESEAKDFWPVYDQYQQQLANFNQRIGKLIESYAAAYRTNSMTDEAAKKIIADFVAIEKGEAAMKAFFVPKLSQVLPPKKVARYFQIENKIRAALKYELAGGIPLIP